MLNEKFTYRFKLFIQHLVLDNDCYISRNVGKSKKTWLRRITCIFYSLNYDANIDLSYKTFKGMTRRERYSTVLNCRDRG